MTMDKKQACEWFKRAAELGGDQWTDGGNPAYYELANCYERGDGLAKDNAKAIYWFEKAREHEQEGVDEIDERLARLRQAHGKE